ncbi:hypothetical protein EVJ32_09705 [Exiguobacterium sp. SH5S4]|nr:hypothetical protein EVJ32_09705 [Exiguobacterium sp. SH5S4]
MIVVPIRGGNWNNSSNAGVFYLNLNNPRSNANTNLGFRSAVLSRRSRTSDTMPDGGQNGRLSMPRRQKNKQHRL